MQGDPEPAAERLGLGTPVSRRSQGTAGLLSLMQPTPLVGRIGELEAIQQRLTVEGVRLLSLTGPAGVGKTRLALAAAALVEDAFPDGIVLVDLAPVREPQLLVPALAQALAFIDAGPRPLWDRLVEYLRERQLLLLLDNFEQVLSAAKQLADLLAACPELVVLVTSRVPLHLRWEHIVRIQPLPVPDLTRLPPLDDLAQIPAVALFLQRAHARQASFALTEAQAPLVAQVVVGLDGLPLAIELAAARLDALSLRVIVGGLEHGLHLLQWGAQDLPARQRSLEIAVGWSYEQLNEEEQRLFRHLGVFVGQVSVAAIAAVCAGVVGAGDEAHTLELLASLADKSLVLPGRSDEAVDEAEPAFSMLETVRQYARERLARRGELEAARRAHAHAFLALAERAGPELSGREQRTWFLRLEREHDNLRAALRWLLDQGDPAEREAALRLASALRWFWVARGYHAEGARWLEAALARASETMDPAVRTRGMLAAGALLTFQGAYARAEAILEETLALARERHDAAGSALALTYLGVRALFGGEAAEAVLLLEEVLKRWQELGEPHFIGVAQFYLGSAAQAANHATEAAARYTEALRELEAAGDVRVAASAHLNFAALLGQQGDLPAAVRHVRAGLEICVHLRDRWLLSIGARVASALVGDHLDDTEPAQRARLLGAADALKQATGAALAAWEHVSTDHDVSALRQRLAQGEWAVAYREGRSLPFEEIATLALSMLEEFARTQAAPQLEAAPSRSSQPPEAAIRGENPLTEREREVLRLVAQGQANKAIARQLIISPSTVNYHLTSIFNKLGVDTRAQAVAVATQCGLL
jgi:non-specific serine/threonine protein kinase